jgi:hypothetical protein
MMNVMNLARSYEKHTPPQESRVALTAISVPYHGESLAFPNSLLSEQK